MDKIMKKMSVCLIACLIATVASAAVRGKVIQNTISTNATLNEVTVDISGELLRVVFDSAVNNSIDYVLKSATDGTTLITSTNNNADVTISTNAVYFNGLTFGAGNGITNATPANAIIIYKD